MVKKIRSIKSDRLVGVLLDTNGPKIRTGRLRDGQPVYLETGAKFTFVNDPDFVGDENGVSSSYTKRIVQAGDKVI